jgi:type I restriction enzyme S subunit
MIAVCQIRRWQDMERWDWILYSSMVAGSKIPSHRAIGTFLKRRIESVDRKTTPFSELTPISIHFDGSITKRELKKDREYTLPMIWVRPGDVVLSKIDLKNGAVGILSEVWPDAAVTTHFAVYEPDRHVVVPEYFHLLIQTPHFKQWLAHNKSGQDGRTEVKLDDFEELDVPLPDVPHQQRLVTAYQAALNAAAKLEAQAAHVERKGQLEFEAALGLVPPPDLPKRRFQIARFKQIGRWSHEGILQSMLLGDQAPESKFEMVSLEDIATVNYGLQKCPGNRPGKHPRPYLRVANVQRGRLDLREIKHINVPEADMPKYRLESGDVLFVEGNGSRKELGRVAIWNGEIENCVHQNHIIKARLDQSKAIPEFIAAWFNTEAGRMHFFRNAKTTSGLGTINSTEVRIAPLPLPDKKVQAAVVRDLERTAQKARPAPTQTATPRNRRCERGMCRRTVQDHPGRQKDRRQSHIRA